MALSNLECHKLSLGIVVFTIYIVQTEYFEGKKYKAKEATLLLM